MYEMDWRQYDPALGRFNTIDKMADSSVENTPYHYGNNNPMFFKDPTGLFSTVVNEDGEVTDHKDDEDTNIYLNSRSGPVIGQEEEGREYNKGDKIYTADKSNNDFIKLTKIVGLGTVKALTEQTVIVYTIPKEIPVYNSAGKKIGVWLTKLKVPFKSLRMVAGKLSPVLRGTGFILGGLDVYNNVSSYQDGEIGGFKLTYRTLGTVGSFAVAGSVGGPAGTVAGVIVGGAFYGGELVYHGVERSIKDTSDPDGNANTVHSIGEFLRNFNWISNNLENGLLEGIGN
jgi:hypothetical protein